LVSAREFARARRKRWWQVSYKKNGDEVIEIVRRAGLARKVARPLPIGVIKGSQSR